MVKPARFVEAKKDPKWMAAMHRELDMIEKNKTSQLVERP